MEAKPIDWLMSGGQGGDTEARSAGLTYTGIVLEHKNGSHRSEGIELVLVVPCPCADWRRQQGGNLLEDAHEQDQLDGDDQLAGDANTVRLADVERKGEGKREEGGVVVHWSSPLPYLTSPDLI